MWSPSRILKDNANRFALFFFLKITARTPLRMDRLEEGREPGGRVPLAWGREQSERWRRGDDQRGMEEADWTQPGD